MKKTAGFFAALVLLVGVSQGLMSLMDRPSVRKDVAVTHQSASPAPVAQSEDSNVETQEIEVSFTIGIGDHSKVVYARPTTNAVAAVSAQ